MDDDILCLHHGILCMHVGMLYMHVGMLYMYVGMLYMHVGMVCPINAIDMFTPHTRLIDYALT